MEDRELADAASRRVFAAVKERRSEVWKYVATVVVLALALNLVSDALGKTLGPAASASIGVVALLALAGYALRLLRRRSMQSYRMFVVGQPDGSVVQVPRYSFGETMPHLLLLGLNTSHELREEWLHTRDEIIREAAEYFVLNALARHLERYVNQSGRMRQTFTRFSKADLVSAGTSNRLLELLAEPEEIPVDYGDFEGKLMGLFLPGGTSIQQYALHLPDGSSLARASDGALVVDTGRLRMSIAVTASPAGHVVPAGFVEDYLGPDARAAHVIELEARIDLDVSHRTFLIGLGRRYTDWVDSFLVELHETTEARRFLDRIGWDQAQTLMHAAGGSSRLPRRPGDDPRPLVTRVVDALANAGLEVDVSQDGARFRVRRGSAAIHGELAEIDGELAVRLVAPLLSDVAGETSRTCRVLEELNRLSQTVPLVRFTYDAEERAVLMLHDVFIGDRPPEDVVLTVVRMGIAADEFDDRLQVALGTGLRLADVAVADPDGPPRNIR
jgi:type III secretion system-like peptide-binding chaperone